MDAIKRNRLIARLSDEPAPQIVPIDEFFDGNDDLSSIGCNLNPHPGIAAFRDLFASLAQRPDVIAIYAQIAELDPGEGCWPFTDLIYVVGDIAAAELTDLLTPLQPDEVGAAADFGLPNPALPQHNAPVLAA